AAAGFGIYFPRNHIQDKRTGRCRASTTTMKFAALGRIFQDRWQFKGEFSPESPGWEIILANHLSTASDSHLRQQYGLKLNINFLFNLR
ncbi:MAG: hypothetical protein ACC631_07015, partial [Halocynthiibacter sp.]